MRTARGKEPEFDFAGLKSEWEEQISATGIPLEEAGTRLLYAPAQEEPGYAEDIGFPGLFPYTRGVYPTMYRGRPWTMRQYAGFATARESNKRYRFLLEKGQTGLSVAFDLPTQLGYDSDHPMAAGEVGRVGVAIDSLRDMEVLFEGIPLDSVSLSMTINSTAPILLALYVAAADQQGVDRAALRGTLQNDILKEYAARGTYIFPPEPSLRLVGDSVAFCAQEIPRFNPISVSGYHIREAGSTAAQEVAFTMAHAFAYCEVIVGRGLLIDDFAPRMSFFFSAHNNLLEEVAKFRAARRLWARRIAERYDPGNPKSCQMRFHVQTAGSTLVAQQPENNTVRVAYQALAAVLGGAQSLHTNSWDEAYALPSEEAARMALRTQQVLAHETGVTDTVDPLGGSYCVEALTHRIEEEAWTLIHEIEEGGGVVSALQNGLIQSQIQQASYEQRMCIERGESKVVGQNCFREEAAQAPVDLLEIDEEVQDRQVEDLRVVREQRDARLVEETLRAVREAATSRDNIMPSLIEAVQSYVTVGELTEVLRDVFGVYEQPTFL